MVFAVREQHSQRSKLSLFRLGKSSTQSLASDIVADAACDAPYEQPTHRQMPRQSPSSTNRIVRSARQSASHSASQQYQYRNPRGHRLHPSSEERVENDDVVLQIHRLRADSLPLDHADADFDRNLHCYVRPLSRIQTGMQPASKHSRQRSHFSIPDVIVTTCEEEGAEQLVEFEIPSSKRRSYAVRDATEQQARDQRSFKKASNSGLTRKPAPLISFDSYEIKALGMPRSGSASSISSSTSSSSPISPTEAASVTSADSASSSLSKASASKRSRKASFPLLFGRKSSDSLKNVPPNSVDAQEPLPYSPTTPTLARNASSDSLRYGKPDGLLFSSAEPPPTHSSIRNIFTRRAINSLPSPPVTPTSPPRSVSKKELKAKVKQEQALIKELERIDKLVKQHDIKARKAQEKAQARDRKRAARLGQTNEPFPRLSLDNRPSGDAVRSHGSRSVSSTTSRISKQTTIFQASTKASGRAIGVARRSSLRSAASDTHAGAGQKRSSEPTLSKPPIASGDSTSATPFSLDMSGSERLPFTQPRPAPKPNVACAEPTPSSASRRSARPPSLSEKSCLPRRPTRLAPSLPVQAGMKCAAITENTADVEMIDGDASTGDDTGDTSQAWTRISWSELASGFTASPLPSLIRSITSRNSADCEEADQVDELDEQEQHNNARSSKRASVQFALALSDVSSSVLQKRASLSKRRSRRSMHVDGLDEARRACAGKRSSDAASMKRRSFIRQLGDDEGWKIVSGADDVGEQEDLKCRLDDSIIAQPNLSMTRWDDWVEHGPPEEPDWPSAGLTQQRVSAQVDLVLADLYLAQNADSLRALKQQQQQQQQQYEASSECTPTQESTTNPFSVLTPRSSTPPPTRPNRSARRTASPTATAVTKFSISSADSFASDSTSTTSMSDFTTLADDSQIDPARNTVVAEKVCYSRPFSSEQRDGNKENVSMGRRREGKDGWGGDVKTRFRLSLAPLAPLQMQQDVFAGIEGKF